MRKSIILRHRNFNKQKTGQAQRAVILVGILVLGLILLAGCRQRPREVELEKKELVPLEEMVPLEPVEETSIAIEVAQEETIQEQSPVSAAEITSIGSLTQASIDQEVTLKGTIVSVYVFKSGKGRTVKLSDGTGTIDIFVWNDLFQQIPQRASLNPGTSLQVSGKISSYQGKLQIKPDGASAIQILSAVAAIAPIVAPAVAPAVVAGKININTATQAQLETLPKIGPVTAQAIIATRPFSSIEDITRTPRIGPKTYEVLKNLITVGGTAVPAVVPTAAPAVTPTAAPPAVAPAAVTGKININTATQAQLETLPKIGPVTAQGIIAGRPYSSIEDLDKVPRIGPKTIENLRPYVTVE